MNKYIVMTFISLIALASLSIFVLIFRNKILDRLRKSNDQKNVIDDKSEAEKGKVEENKVEENKVEVEENYTFNDLRKFIEDNEITFEYSFSNHLMIFTIKIKNENLFKKEGFLNQNLYYKNPKIIKQFDEMLKSMNISEGLKNRNTSPLQYDSNLINPPEFFRGISGGNNDETKDRQEYERIKNIVYDEIHIIGLHNKFFKIAPSLENIRKGEKLQITTDDMMRIFQCASYMNKNNVQNFTMENFKQFVNQNKL